MITIKATGDTTIYTAGKYCEEDILVKVPEGSGGESTPTQEKTVNITKNGTTEITPDDGYALSKVTANVSVPIPDGYIMPSGTLEVTENGTHNVMEYASVKVDVPEPKLQNKTVTPNEEIQSIMADSGYDGLNTVMVNPIPGDYIIPSGVKDIVTNGQYDVTDKASVSVNVPIPEGYIQPSGELEITENGQYDVTEKASVNVVVPEREIVLQEKTVTENGEVTPDSGYDGLSKVTVNVPTGGGGGEVNMGTCTVVIVPPSNTNYYVAREAVSNGTITYTMSRNYTGNKFTVSNVRCDSILWVMASVIKGAEVSDGELLRLQSGQGVAYKTPSTAGASATITLSS